VELKNTINQKTVTPLVVHLQNPNLYANCVYIFLRTHNSKIRIMDTYNLNGITVAAILDNRRETKSGAYPVKIRVTYKRERKYFLPEKICLFQIGKN
jgi:hypothetical protein